MEIFHKLGTTGEGIERYRMVALEVPPEADLPQIRKLLEHGAAEGWWHWEEGCVTAAQHCGYLRHWSGDVGVDATSIPVLARPDSDRSGTASVEITAGRHYRGGSDEGGFGPPQTVVRLADRRSRASHPAARPTVRLPDGERTDPPRKDELPAVCGASAISVPADAAGDLKTAEFRQDSHYSA
ncbi:DUF4265 domain-containing protein [Streptomyces sp. 2132.2]|uniref:DUF4265 domain-containing protein n=1 Tax=Streptomyces sp. 2132.2 TaxID=2485161 RepID=UPI00288AE0D0|nr:DUF4265 domain-containing protein [Streptomyces sp. 2132.2]